MKIYFPTSFTKPQGAKEAVSVKEAVQIYENVFSSGDLEGIEQALVIKTQQGLIVIVGCSHPRVRNILNAPSNFEGLHRHRRSTRI